MIEVCLILSVQEMENMKHTYANIDKMAGMSMLFK